jgi:acetylornithine/succinyldiaminopimelate/putrescine aminotransferase
MTTNDVIKLFDEYVIANYFRLPRVIVKGKGSYIYDLEGNKILDLFPGWAVSGIGHCHPKVVKAIQAQAKLLLHMDNTFYTELQGKLAKLLADRAFGGKAFSAIVGQRPTKRLSNSLGFPPQKANTNILPRWAVFTAELSAL